MFVIINRNKERRGPGKYKFISSAYTLTLERYWEMTRNYRLIRYRIIDTRYVYQNAIIC